MAVPTTSEPQSGPEFALAQKLYGAAEAGDLDGVNQALDKGVDIDTKGGKHGTALVAAVICNNANVVRLLLERGANANVQSGRLETPLFAAARSGNLPVVQLLLANGAGLSATSEECGDPFHAACLGGNFPVMKFLFDSGADPYTRCPTHVTSLQAAAMSGKEGSMSIVRLLLAIGVNVNDQGGKFGTALQGAVYSSNIPIVQLLVDSGADINAQCGELGNALQVAAAEGGPYYWPSDYGIIQTADTFYDIVQLLLDRGADVNAQGGRYGNALHAAIYTHCYRTADLLLEKGASPCFLTRSPNGTSILHDVIESEYRLILKTLLENGGNVTLHLKDSSGRTPLHSAVDSMDLISLELLYPYIDKSALNDIDIDGNTPLHSAVDRSTADIVDWLVRKGANAALLDSDAMTPFQQAAKKNNFPALRSLFPNTPKESRGLKASKWRALSLASKEYGINIVITDAIKILSYEELSGYLACSVYDGILSFKPTWALIICPSVVRKRIIGNDRGWKTTVIIVDKIFCDEYAYGVNWTWWPTLYDGRSDTIPTTAALSRAPPTQVPLEIRETNHAIGWIMVRNTPPHEANCQSDLETRFIFSTLEYVNIPSSPTDLFMPLVQQLNDEWSDVCKTAVKHLSRMRSETFQCNGTNSKLIKIHLKDAQQWSRFGELLDQQISVLRSLAKTYGDKRPAVLAKESVLWAKDEILEFDEAITELGNMNQLKFKNLASVSQELIQLEFNLTSIAEARLSTSTNRSLKRLSWITFVFLPLMFISSVFGMNVNVLANNPAWWLYIPFALGTVVLSLTVWVLFKRNPKLEDTIETKFEFLFKSRSDRNRPPDEEEGLETKEEEKEGELKNRKRKEQAEKPDNEHRFPPGNTINRIKGFFKRGKGPDGGDVENPKAKEVKSQ
ncbi:Ankyrin-2 [Onygenales sp. PD_40]|nr:Ankyrin-2 [Onygenales sp. PD_40]KAK2784318.1 Ankyrin-2 [Onygenales sp. PD_10]